MSIAFVDSVMKNERLKGAEKLVMLAIANHADAQGRAFPSVARIARQCGFQPRYTNEILAKLTAKGELKVTFRAGPRGTNVFEIPESCPQPLSRDALLQEPVSPSPPPTLLPSAQPPASGRSNPLSRVAGKPSANHQEAVTWSTDGRCASAPVGRQQPVQAASALPLAVRSVVPALVGAQLPASTAVPPSRVPPHIRARLNELCGRSVSAPEPSSDDP